MLLRWPLPPPDLTLEPYAIHVWAAALDAAPDRLGGFRTVLSPDERARAERFRFERHRRRFTVARGVLRHLLAFYLDTAPHQLELSYSKYDKPFLAGQRLRFNVSHSHELALFAFCWETAVGVDVEYVQRPMQDAPSIARNFFSASENAVFTAVSPAHQNQAFFNCWTRKEAFIKAVGEGLSYPLDAFDVTLRPGEPARFLQIRGSADEARRWSLFHLEPAPDYAGALALRGEDWQLSRWRFEQ